MFQNQQTFSYENTTAQNSWINSQKFNLPRVLYSCFKGSRKLPWPCKHLRLPDVRNQSDATEGKRKVHWDGGDCCSWRGRRSGDLEHSWLSFLFQLFQSFPREWLPNHFGYIAEKSYISVANCIGTRQGSWSKPKLQLQDQEINLQKEWSETGACLCISVCIMEHIFRTW